MPLNDFRCTKCGDIEERIAPMGISPECLVCSAPTEKLPSSPALIRIEGLNSKVYYRQNKSGQRIDPNSVKS